MSLKPKKSVLALFSAKYFLNINIHNFITNSFTYLLYEIPGTILGATCVKIVSRTHIFHLQYSKMHLTTASNVSDLEKTIDLNEGF